MSGSINSIVSGIVSVGQLFGSGGSTPVTLGAVQFEAFEVPEKIPFGGEQKVNVHRLPGGTRIVDSMGPDDRDIDFSGTFMGSGAASRARQLDSMRKAGAKITLAWADFRREVVITRFECDYTYGGQVLPYTIACVVVSSANAGDEKPGLISQIGKDLTDSLGITDIIGPAMTEAQGALKAVQKVMPVAASITRGSAAFVSVSSAVSGASSVLSAGVAGADKGMGGVIAAGQAAGRLLGGTGAGGAFSTLSTAVSAAGSLAGHVQASGYVDRIAANLKQTSA